MVAKKSNYIFLIVLQTILIFITNATLLFFLYIGTIRFTSFDKMPQFLPITPQKIKEFGQSPAKVKIGLYILDFPEFDIIKNQFVFDGIISFEFDPSVVSLDTLKNFSFEKGTIERISEPKTIAVDNGKIFAQFDTRVKFRANLNEDLFPFNDRSIHIVVINKELAPGEVIFEAPLHNFNITNQFHTPGWEYFYKTTRVGYTEAQLDQNDPSKNLYYPQAIFEIDFRRSGIRHALMIILPLILIFNIALFSFTLDPINYINNLGISIGTITAILAYRFVIEQLSPQVGYFMLADYIYFLFLILVFIIFIVTLLSQKLNITVKALISIFLQTILIIAMAYLLRYWLF